MPQIAQSDFSLGWRPSDDLVNGPKNCLLRQQNLKLDENFALTLIPGSVKINDSLLASAPHDIYSKVINGTRYRFVARNDSEVDCDASGAYNTFLTAFGDPAKTAFGSAYNLVIISGSGGNFKYIPSISTTALEDLTTETPATVSVSVNNPYTKDMTGTIASYVALVGTVSPSGGYVKCVPDATILSVAASLVTGAIDSTNLSGGSKGQDTDSFNITVNIDDPTQIDDITILFKDHTDIANYFSVVFKSADIALSPGQPLKLQCTRGDFDVNGRPSWSNIGEVVVVFAVLDTVTNCYFKDIIFSGGTLGELNGDLEYIQVFTNNNTPYLSRSASNSGIFKISVVNSYTTVTVQTPVGADANGYEVYRRGGGLDRFYLVKSANNFIAFDDHLSDQDALLIGVTLNENLRGLGLIFPLLQIVGPFFNRWIYFTSTAIYISQDGNPELYSLGTGVITPYGSSSEKFMWAEKFGNSAILVGTTNDIYEITGTFSELPDGTIDIVVRPTGCKNPPIADAYAATANELYYVASDGIRQVNPSGNMPFWTELDLLFKGKIRYGMVPPKVNGGNVDKHILAISHNELYYSFVDTGGLRKMFTYDLLRKYCYEFKSDDGGYGAPVCLFTEEDGSLTAGFSDSSNLYVRVLNTGTLIDNSTNPVVYLRTKVFNGDTPRQRKDSYTLKLKIDTGSSGIEVRVYLDESSSFISLGFINTASLLEKFIDLSSVVGVCKSYQIELAGNCPRFKLTDFTLDYELRPAPLSYYRSQPTNYGIEARKRIYELPIIIDTLGSPVLMTPIIDGINQTPISFTTVGKTTYNYVFQNPAVGHDINFTLLETGGAGFEFYGEIQPRVIEPLPDAVISYIIPYTNLGTYARKRIMAFAFVIDTNGEDVFFTPKVDGVNLTTKVVNTLDKRTYVYYMDSIVEGTDISGFLQSALSTKPFEFFGPSLEECISEKLPPSATNFRIPNSNLGTYARKRFIAYAFVIDTKGATCNFSPIIDGVTYPGSFFNTNGKRTYIYYFPSRTEGIDIGGILSCLTNFEFYAVSLEECISEKLPPSCTYLIIPPNNFGSASKKRIRTIPLIIDTRGQNVTYTPYVDGIAFPSTVFNTNEKRTVLYYFTSDAFGIDISGTLSCPTSFEFYGLGTPENVEILPVGKMFDQLGPLEFLRNSNIKGFRVRMVATGTSFTYTVYVDDVQTATDVVQTLPNIDKTYEIPWIRKYMNGTTCRIEISSSNVFHRFSAELRVNETGSQTQGRWKKM